MHKRSFFLIEAVVSLLIFSIIIAILMSLFSLSSTMFVQIKKKDRVLHEELFTQNFLFQIFSSIITHVPASEGKAYFFTHVNNNTNSTELIFSFDNKWQSDANFSNHLYGKLYITPKKELCLATWPINLGFAPEAGDVTIIKIADNVSKLAFAFFPDTPIDTTNQTAFTNKNWSTSWPKEYAKKFPHFISIALFQQDKQATSYYFFIPEILPKQYNLAKDAR